MLLYEATLKSESLLNTMPVHNVCSQEQDSISLADWAVCCFPPDTLWTNPTSLPDLPIIVNTQWSGNKAQTNPYTWSYHPITCCDGSSFFYSSTGPLLHAVSSTHVPDNEHDVWQQTCSSGWPCWITRYSFLSYNVGKLAIYSFMHPLCQQVQS